MDLIEFQKAAYRACAREIINEKKNIHETLIELVESGIIEAALVAENGNESAAAKLIGMNRGTFRKKRRENLYVD